MDKLTPEARSRNMSRIRSRDTSPELAVRRFLHGKGLRFRLHVRKLAGKPDLVFGPRSACLFVHGCFWHGCPRCVDGRRRVKDNAAYWSDKVAGNRARDERHRTALEREGWTVFVLWECEIRDAARLTLLAEQIRTLPSRSASHPGAQPPLGERGSLVRL
jgi:DNA mismatch endonuclease (patch repair protein)